MQFPSLFEVSSPYYALDREEISQPGSVKARVHPVQSLGYEQGPVTAAEAGRHLTVLGACACSSLHDDPLAYCFLPERLRLLRLSDCEAPTYSMPLTAAAWAGASAHGSTARAHAVLSSRATGERLFEAEVLYRVMSRAAFERVFARHKRERSQPGEPQPPDATGVFASLRNDPYRDPLPLEITRRTPGSVRARLRRVTQDLCIGHLPQYPALPVSSLMHGLSSLCGDALRLRYGHAARYRVLCADVSAERLAFVGERVFFEAAYVRSVDEREHYQAWATAEDGSCIGWADVELEAAAPVSHAGRVALTAAAFF